jgi:hypothetical protein
MKSGWKITFLQALQPMIKGESWRIWSAFCEPQPQPLAGRSLPPNSGQNNNLLASTTIFVPESCSREE